MPQASLQTTTCNGQMRTFCFLHGNNSNSFVTKYLPLLSRSTGTRGNKGLSQKQSSLGKCIVKSLLLASFWFLIIIIHPLRYNNCLIIVTFWCGLKLLENCQELVRICKELHVFKVWKVSSGQIFLFFSLSYFFFFFLGGNEDMDDGKEQPFHLYDNACLS